MIFANTVLMNLEDITSTDNQMFLSGRKSLRNRSSGSFSDKRYGVELEGNVAEGHRMKSESEEYLKNDFKKIKQTMTRCRFRLDISFLC